MLPCFTSRKARKAVGLTCWRRRWDSLAKLRALPDMGTAEGTWTLSHVLQHHGHYTHYATDAGGLSHSIRIVKHSITTKLTLRTMDMHLHLLLPRFVMYPVYLLAIYWTQPKCAASYICMWQIHERWQIAVKLWHWPLKKAIWKLSNNPSQPWS